MATKRTKEESTSKVSRTQGGFFRIKGKVSKIIDNGGKGDTFKVGTISNGGKYDGCETISANIAIATFEEEGVRNEVNLRAFAMKTDTLKGYDFQEAASIDIPYSEWEEYLEVQTEEKKNRYSIFNSIQIKLEGDDEVKTYPTYEGLQLLQEVLEKGQGWFVKGNMEYRTGEDREGNPVVYKSLTPTAFFASDIDFEAEDFTEVNEWHQQMYIVKVTNDKKREKLKIKGRIVTNKDLDYVDTDFVVPYGELPELKEYAESIEDVAEFGDLAYFGGFFRRSAKQVTRKKSFSGGKTHTASAGFGELEYVTDGTYTDARNEDDLIKGAVTIKDFDLLRKEKEGNKIGQAESKEEPATKSRSSFGRSAKKAEVEEDVSTIDIDDDDLPF